MAIPVSEDVRIIPGILNSSAKTLLFSGLFLTRSKTAPVDKLLSFASATEVAEYFGYNTNEHQAAQIYFNGYNNSLTKPTELFFYRHVRKDVPATLRGGKCSDPAQMLVNLRQVRRGSLDITLGPAYLSLENLDFSAINSLSDGAQVLQDAINDAGDVAQIPAWSQAQVSFSSLLNAFEVTAGDPGELCMITYAEGSLASVMYLDEASHGVLSQGAAARTYEETLDNVMTHTCNFATYSTCEEVSTVEEALSLASWAVARFNEGNAFTYVFYTTDTSLNQATGADLQNRVGTGRVGKASVSNAGLGTAIANELLNGSYEGTVGVYGNVQYAAFFMGAAASIDWDQTNSTITFKFKQQSGLAANVTDRTTARALDALKLNYMGAYASRNDNFTYSSQGHVYGSYEFLDTYLNSTWLCDALQAAIVAGFNANGRVPFNDSGKSLIKSWCKTVLIKALKNGVIETGISIDEAQKNTLQREAGMDISSDLINNGYFLKIDDADAATRQERTSPACHLWFAYAGAVHQLELPVTTVS